MQHFAMTLPLQQRQDMLMVVSAICWSIWTTRNSICFDNKCIPFIRQMILLIFSLLDYWLGNKKKRVGSFTHLWIYGYGANPDNPPAF